MNKTAAATLAIILACSMAAAYDPTQNMNLKWRYSLPSPGRSFTVADVDGDGADEIIAGLYNNTIIVMSNDGKIEYDFALGNNSIIGKIYALTADDLNGDGKAEIIAGMGGLRVTENYQLYGFTSPNASQDKTGQIQWMDKVLYRTIRNLGGVYVTNNTGYVIWKKPVYNSVISLHAADINKDERDEIITGVGDYGVDIYSEAASVNYTNRSCSTEFIEDDYTGYDKEKCTCSGCVWHEKTQECLQSYSETTCVIHTEVVPGRVLVEYPIKNGSAVIYDRNGELIWRKDFQTYDEHGGLVGDADNNVRKVYAGDVDYDGRKDIFVGLENGTLNVYNISGTILMKIWPTGELVGSMNAVQVIYFNATRDISVIIGTSNGFIGAFDTKRKDDKPTWVARARESVESMDLDDIDVDDVEEIIVGSGDGSIYIYDPDGINEWYYPTGSPIYYISSHDFSGDGYKELVAGSLSNLTVYEMNKDYVLRRSASSFYDKAESQFSLSDYTVAMLYATKSKNIYLEIKDAEGINRCDVLIKKINDELIARKKFEADAFYDRAVAAYARNDLNTSLSLLRSASRIYAEIKDTVGVNRCEKMSNDIERFIIEEKIVAADAHYSRALKLFSFRNYTETIEESHAAKDIYEEVGFSNGTIKTNKLLTRLAEAYYTDAQIFMSNRKFNASLAYANNAMELFNETKTYDGTAKTELLIQEIKKRMNQPYEETPEIDYTTGAILLACIIAVIIIIIIRRRASGQRKDVGVEKYDL
ncbi:MAG: VCBS repeat-containing protein [Candidatus Altiarchaeota archaeon]|nr:VCBS repeat-containing protein [Candidatus Altiarchaeota archaeon]